MLRKELNHLEEEVKCLGNEVQQLRARRSNLNQPLVFLSVIIVALLGLWWMGN